MLKGRAILIAFSLVSASCSVDTQQAESITTGDKQSSAQPNILLIVADDLGMADIGAFGGEIETPNLDLLASQGVRLTNFRSAPTCSPTRAMLLSGNNNHAAGLGNMAEELAPNQQGKPGYEGYINRRVRTLPERLKQNGYRTYLAGKWHLGNNQDALPTSRGFDRSFALMPGGASHFSDMKPAYAPDPSIKADYREDGKKLSALPKSFHYSSQFYADKIIDYLSADRENPFFAMLSFTAPHWPLQAPEQAIKKYKGRYDQGYDLLRKARLEKQKKLGILPTSTVLADRYQGVPAWDDLTQGEKKASARAMEIYAAMVDEMDRHIGRVITHLKSSGQLDNTIVVFMSDNGAEGHTLDQTWPEDLYPKIRNTINSSHDFSYENMGRPGSYVFYNGGWAAAGSPAYSGYKGYVHEGGVRVPAIIRYPNELSKNLIDERPFNVQDLAATALDFLNINQNLNGDEKGTLPMTGLSIAPQLRDPSLPAPKRVEAFELFGKQAVLSYPWKLIREPSPWGNNQWRLYQLENDRAERKNVIDTNKARADLLIKAWDSYAKTNGVILPNQNSGY